MKTEYLLDTILKIAYDMLVSGSEVGRVEQQIEKMCRAYEMEEVEVFIITSSIIVSVKDKEGKLFTQTKRIREYQTDFYRMKLLEQLAADIQQQAPDMNWIGQAQKEIEERVAKEQMGYGKYYRYLLFSGISMIFTLFFGGSILEGAVSFICGFFICFSMNFFKKIVTNRFILNLVTSATGAFTAWLFRKMQLPVCVDYINIGNIMLLIPGLATVNAIKDLVSGELITGLLRLADALIQAVAVAFGFAIIIWLLGV